jgi:hypothetical protein
VVDVTDDDDDDAFVVIVPVALDEADDIASRYADAILLLPPLYVLPYVTTDEDDEVVSLVFVDVLPT